MFLKEFYQNINWLRSQVLLPKQLPAIENFIKGKFMSKLMTSQHIYRVFLTKLCTFRLEKIPGTLT